MALYVCKYIGGNDDRALPENKSVPFVSPLTLQAEFILPHSGKIVGMLIPKGVTVITGGGYHGKSTILNAIKMGIYNKICGDGREFVVTNIDAIAIRFEFLHYLCL
jgi:predicted ABC-class ATPase